MNRNIETNINIHQLLLSYIFLINI
jgi:hypothetical protein